MSTLLKQTDRRLGWLAAGMLFFLLSSGAWALEVDPSFTIARQDADSTEIMATLGSRHPTAQAAAPKGNKVHLVLLKAKRKVKYARHHYTRPTHKKFSYVQVATHKRHSAG
jgi:hypothetical protein